MFLCEKVVVLLRHHQALVKSHLKTIYTKQHSTAITIQPPPPPMPMLFRVRQILKYLIESHLKTICAKYPLNLASRLGGFLNISLVAMATGLLHGMGTIETNVKATI